MSELDIIHHIAEETGIGFAEMLNAKKGTALKAKYIAQMILYEEHVKADRIGELFLLTKSTVYDGMVRFGVLIDIDREFKNMYLACIKRLAELEDAA